MSCKFHQLRDDIIDRVNAVIKKKLDALNGYSNHLLDLSYLFGKTYMEYYNNEEYKNLFEEAGFMLEETITICIEAFNLQGVVDYKSLNTLVYRLINSYFDGFENKDDVPFGCTHVSPASSENFICIGDGTCFHTCDQCKEEFVENCTCKRGCTMGCVLKKCHNYDFCKQHIPAWVDTMNKSICFDCKYQCGKITIINEITECGICMQDKNMVEIFCGHKMCFECWETIVKNTPQDDSLKTNDNYPSCPICRRKVYEL